MNALSLILEAIDRAHWVYHEEDSQLLFVWRGGAIVNIYETQCGTCVDCFTHTGPHGEYLDRYDIHEEILSYIENNLYPED
jgi:hypothetical protein